MQAIKDLLYGRRYAVVADKKIKIVPDDTPGADTGIDFLYDHFHEIDWFNEFDAEEIGSVDKKTRLKFLNSLKREEFFVDKWLVLPAAYRAEDSESKTLGDNVNGIYKDILSRTRSMKVGFSFDLFGAETKMSVQNLLTQCYLATLAPASGKNIQPDGTLKGTAKNSMIRKHLLGKTLDYTASNVITAAEVSGAERPEDMPTEFGYSAYPLATLVSLFNPFFIQNISTILNLLSAALREKMDPELYYVDTEQFGNDRCEKMIKKFIKSEEERNQAITIEVKNIKTGEIIEKGIKIIHFNSKEDAIGPNPNEKGEIHYLTLTDLMYMIAMDVLVEGNYHVYTTRYPASEF